MIYRCREVQVEAEEEVVSKALEVITRLRQRGWTPRLRDLTIASAASDEWVEFPEVLERPTYYWNRRSGEPLAHVCFCLSTDFEVLVAETRRAACVAGLSARRESLLQALLS